VSTKSPAIEKIMLVDTADGRFGFVVDEVLGDCQTVIKNLGRLYRHVQVVSGATILGDGRVALILDPDRLVQDAVQARANGIRGHPALRKNSRSRDGTAGSSLAEFVSDGQKTSTSPKAR
jgi:two-component system chemotaxis sensor kinase CheA